MDIDKLLFPENGRLVGTEEEGLTAQVIDAEGDPIECKFNYDDCVQLDTSELSYITLTMENLHKLIALIEEAEDRYDSHTWEDEK